MRQIFFLHPIFLCCNISKASLSLCRRLSGIMSFFALTIVFLADGMQGRAQSFDKYFEDNTLRLDYVFAGNARGQSIYLEDMKKQDRWAGRKNRLAETFLKGNGQLTVRDHATQEVIYVWTFATLFQEWLQYDEAKVVDKAFESSYNIPFPKNPVDVTVTLTDNHNNVKATMTHTVDPKDILIRHVGDNGIPFRYICKGNPDAVGESLAGKADITGCVDLAILAEGYTEGQMDKFYADCEKCVEALFAWEPFKSLKNRFNVVAVAAPSLHGGPSVPHDNVWNITAAATNYDTFYSQRYLTTKDMHKVYDLLSCVPFEHIMVLVNSDIYGGGGIYNQVTIATSDNPAFKEVFVHEFGHSYGGLADEYAYDDMDEIWYPADTEPWEPNITTLKDFSSKWADMMPKNQTIPTPLDPKVPDYRKIDRNDARQMAKLNACTQVVGVFEGAGYQTKGCYRPAQECRMKINEVQDFCPVCSRAIQRITEFYTAQ